MFNENIQNNQDISAATSVLAKQYLDLLTQEASLLNKQEQTNASTQAPGPRRQSPTPFLKSSSKKPHLATLVETAQRNFLNAIIAVGNLETLEEKVRTRAFSEGTPALAIESAAADQQQPQSTSTSRYKTELCRPFEENGKCKYGEKCQFAHGKHELRHMVRHPKYKTELCRTYHTNGWCNYGSRCHFIHDQNELPLENQRQLSISSFGFKQSQPTAIDHAQSKSVSFQLTAPQRTTNRLNSYSYSTFQTNSPVEATSTFFDGNEVGTLSPVVGSNGNFNYPMVPLDVQRNPFFDLTNSVLDNRRGSPLVFDFKINPLNDDNAFGSLSPSDSDRESATGSPPGFGGVVSASYGCQQRLPIFRCLSQS